MEDRYEITSKIGAGGLGTVYRGFDTKMKRNVAIKRIMTSEEDPSIQEEAAKQLAAEAGALAALQHPHIVTVYDVGQDEDGPYVVMELINGRTLDEIIEEHPLVWSDFRELAMQSQEALIAAQELNMIHSDLKPPNIILTWLPSGKFQIKIVDFGLAVLAQNQSAEELQQIETVFGSIFFMPPEQFEREVLDARSDLYSIGCVYYQCLTGKYPFMGCDGEEVINAHLNHKVTPIQDIRADVPIWVCEWVMWLINRDRDDRPRSAKEALAVFLQNDRQPNPEMSIGRPKKTGPKLIIPGAALGDPDAPEPIQGLPIVPPGDMESVEMMAAYEEPEPEPQAEVQLEAQLEAHPEPQPEPQPESEPDIAKIARVQPTGVPGKATQPTVKALQPIVTAEAGQPLGGTSSAHATVSVATQEQQIEQQQIATPVAKPPKPPMSTAAKAMIGVVLGIAIIVVGMILLEQSKQNRANERLNMLMNQAKADGTTEVEMSRADLEMVLRTAAHTGAMDNRVNYYQLLTMAKSASGENFDIAILNFAKQDVMLSEVRSSLIGDVLRLRGNSEIIILLLDYATTTTDMDAAVAALRAAHDMAGQGHTNRFLDVIVETDKPALRTEAERTLGRLIDEAVSRDSISTSIATAADRSDDPDIQHAMIRLLGRCSTTIAMQRISAALKSQDSATRLAATVALGNWKDVRAINELLKHLGAVKEPTLRHKAFEALLKVSSSDFIFKDQTKAQEIWSKIRTEATSRQEKLEFINALATATNDYAAPWALSLVQPLASDADPNVAERAKKAVAHITNKEAQRNKK